MKAKITFNIIRNRILKLMLYLFAYSSNFALSEFDNFNNSSLKILSDIVKTSNNQYQKSKINFNYLFYNKIEYQ